jgi:hypothetical protein
MLNLQHLQVDAHPAGTLWLQQHHHHCQHRLHHHEYQILGMFPLGLHGLVCLQTMNYPDTMAGIEKTTAAVLVAEYFYSSIVQTPSPLHGYHIPAQVLSYERTGEYTNTKTCIPHQENLVVQGTRSLRLLRKSVVLVHL